MTIVVLELVRGSYPEAGIIGALLVFNAGLGLFQEGRAQATPAALRSRLAKTASVRRDGLWATLPAAELVPGDVVKLSLGGVVAADVRLTEGNILLDQSMLTGESVPIEAGAGLKTFAGALVRRGEAVAEVTATGANTKCCPRINTASSRCFRPAPILSVCAATVPTMHRRCVRRRSGSLFPRQPMSPSRPMGWC